MIEIVETDDLSKSTKEDGDSFYFFPFKLTADGQAGFKINTLPVLNKFGGYSQEDGEYALRAGSMLPREEWGLHKIAKIYHDKANGYAMIVAHKADPIKNWGELWLNSEERAKMRASVA
jgi:hypothetical protein